jgi:hypothetical protein
MGSPQRKKRRCSTTNSQPDKNVSMFSMYSTVDTGCECTLA